MKNKRRSLRAAAAIVGGAATIALVPVLPAVSQESPPVGGNSPARVEVCLRGHTLTVPERAATALVERAGATAGPCA